MCLRSRSEPGREGKWTAHHAILARTATPRHRRQTASSQLGASQTRGWTCQSASSRRTRPRLRVQLPPQHGVPATPRLQDDRLKRAGERIDDGLVLGTWLRPDPHLMRAGRKGEHAQAWPVNPVQIFRSMSPCAYLAVVVAPLVDFASCPGRGASLPAMTNVSIRRRPMRTGFCFRGSPGSPPVSWLFRRLAAKPRQSFRPSSQPGAPTGGGPASGQGAGLLRVFMVPSSGFVIVTIIYAIGSTSLG